MCPSHVELSYKPKVILVVIEVEEGWRGNILLGKVPTKISEKKLLSVLIFAKISVVNRI